MGNYILAIESSCDDTAASVLCDQVVLSNKVYSQDIHKKYGGIVPEVASRAHQENIIPVVSSAIDSAGIILSDLRAIAFTRGPGLMGSLMVGVSFAKALALSLEIPMIEVNHMQAHVLSHFIDPPTPSFPFLCLTVSGGHTQIVLVRDHLDMDIVGETLDDAAGEAFDKTGKMLGLEYPAGPVIDKLAKEGRPIFPFPEPQIAGLNFSFSGFKTAVLYFLRDHISRQPDFVKSNLHDICASIQYRIVRILSAKLKKASIEYDIKEIAIAGGVSANSGLRNTLMGLKEEMNWNVYLPKIEYCTDNAAMIGIAAYFKFQKSIFVDHHVFPDPRLSFNFPKHANRSKSGSPRL